MLEKNFSDDSHDFVFEDKQWRYVTDNSNSGNYGTGQVIFDATPLMSNGWQNWSECVAMVPLVMALTSTAAAKLTADAANAFVRNVIEKWIPSIGRFHCGEY